MIAVLFIALYAGVLCTIYGLIAAKGLERVCRLESRSRLGLPETWILGACVLAVLATWLSLLMPLGAVAGGLALAVAIAAGLRMRREVAIRLEEGASVLRALRWPAAVLVGLIVLRVVAQTTYPPQIFDTGLYHLQVVAMIEEFPVVPGLANVDDRYGLHSNWFPLLALFHLSYLGLPPFHAFNGVFQLFVVAASVPALARVGRGSTSFADVFAVLMLLPWLVRRSEFSSLGADLAVGHLTFLCVYLYLRRTRSFDLAAALLFLLPIFALTVKLSAAPLLLFSAYVAAIHGRRAAPLVAIALAPIAPWCARMYIQSGYVVYPLIVSGFFDPDWKLPAATVENGSHGRYALAVARLRDVSPELTLAMPFWEWIPRWFARQGSASQAMMVAVSLGALASVPRMLRQPGLDRWFAHLVLVGGLVFWLLTAPDLRFAQTTWWCLGALLVTPIVSNLLVRFGRPAVNILIASSLIWTLLAASVPSDVSQVRANWLFQGRYPVAQTETRQVDSTTVHVAGQCWYAPRPCTHYLPPGLRMRGARLEDGFYFPRG